MFKTTLSVATLFVASAASAGQIPITGNVASKCSIFTDTPGVYGNPTPDELSTLPSDGGVMPIVRYDVALAESYTASIAWPTGFSSSPAIDDAQAWTGEVEVSSVSDTTMAGYEAAKIEFDNVTQFDLTHAGSVWFKVTSEMNYGYGKTLPGGEYVALISADCIAN